MTVFKFSKSDLTGLSV